MDQLVLPLLNILFGLLFIGLSFPLVNGKIKMNHIFGVRFSKSFESEKHWYHLNRFGGKRLAFWSIPIIILGLLGVIYPENTIMSAVQPVLVLIIIIPALEIWFMARKL